MAIKLTNGFKPIPEGTHVFRITEVEYDEDFGKMTITLKTAKGEKHVERFSLLKSDGEPNEGAMNAFSYFAKVAMNDMDLEVIEDPQCMVGHYMRCEVTHEQVLSPKTGRMMTFARLGDKESCDGYDDPADLDLLDEKPKVKNRLSLDDILG